jgi:imidazolonepropionase
MWDALWINATVATLHGPDGIGLLPTAAVAIRDGNIAWVGRQANLPGEPATLARAVNDCAGRLMTPGLIDCHTHLVFGGDRALDFALRAEGASYEAIAAAGGGIRSTVALTRNLSEEALAQAALPRAQALLRDGITTIEIKSGYGLDVASELKMLRAARRLETLLDVEIHTTLLALHALPEAFTRDRKGYVDLVTRELIPEAARLKLATAVDVFCEKIAFTRAECAQVLTVARDYGFGVKVHADQLSAIGAAELAAEYGALSADHVEYTTPAGIDALAHAGTVAVLLPVAFVVIGETQKPPVAALRAAGVPIAIATDCNPGTSPCTSLTLAASLARAEFGLTASEALRGVTVEAARALGMRKGTGTVSVSAPADLCLWDLSHPREFGYWLGNSCLHTRIRRGRISTPHGELV